VHEVGGGYAFGCPCPCPISTLSCRKEAEQPPKVWGEIRRALSERFGEELGTGSS